MQKNLFLSILALSAASLAADEAAVQTAPTPIDVLTLNREAKENDRNPLLSKQERAIAGALSVSLLEREGSLFAFHLRSLGNICQHLSVEQMQAILNAISKDKDGVAMEWPGDAPGSLLSRLHEYDDSKRTCESCVMLSDFVRAQMVALRYKDAERLSLSRKKFLELLGSETPAEAEPATAEILS